MRITLRLPIVIVLMAFVAACTSAQQADSPVQLPGDPSRTGLEVPPNVWEHPTVQAAIAIPQR